MIRIGFYLIMGFHFLNLRFVAGLFFFVSFLLQTVLVGQGTYYDSINTASPTFVNDLKERVRRNYTKELYSNFDETNIANYASYSKGDGTRGVKCVYTGYEYTYTGTFVWDIMSREHTWCYSWMPSHGSSSTNEYADQHHLFPTHQNGANGVRSNHPLGVVVTATSTFLNGKYGTNALGQKVYEPQDAQKGDAARALLYMVLRYDDVTHNWDFNWLNNTKLPSLNEAPQDLSLLIQWSLFDPPDAWERGRNEYIFSIQKNRNPFIDHPEYINYIDFNDMTYKAGGSTLSTEPTNYVTNFAAGTISSNSIQMTWTDAIAGSQVPSGYLLIMSTSPISAPTDGVSYPDDTDVSDGLGRVNVSYNAADEYTFSNLFGSTTYYSKIYSYNGNGSSINYKTDNTVPALSAVTLVAALSSEPTNHCTNLSTSNVTNASITLNWTDALPGAQVPTGYLIVASAGSIVPPVDEIDYPIDTDLSDGNARVKVLHSAPDTYTFNNLSPNTSYNFKIYSYNGSGSSINYKTDGAVPTISATTIDAYSTSQLNPGDILIIGFNMTNPDQFAFVPLVNLAGGASISFTDNGWQSNNTFRTGEGTLTWTAPSSGVLKGTIIRVDTTASVTIGSLVSAGSFLLATAGDQILAYTGSSSSPKFLYAVNDSGSSWQANALTANSSALPLGLVNNETAVALVKKNNGIYSEDILGDEEQLRLNVSTPSYWTMSDSRLTMPSGILPLPVELTSFTGVTRGRKVVLRWVTATEINNFGFEVERTLGGLQSAVGSLSDGKAGWQKIGFMQGHGNSNSPKEYSFIDKSASAGLYSYRLKQIDNGGKFEYSNEIEIDLSVPSKFILEQNYPNPFNPSTKIGWQQPFDSHVSLKVYDILGNEVVALVDEHKKAGSYEVEFSIRGGNSKHLASGVYFYRIAVHSDNRQSGDFILQKKLIILK